MNTYGYGHRLRAERDPNERVEPPPADFMIADLAAPHGTYAAKGFLNCRTCDVWNQCRERQRRHERFARPECEAALVNAPYKERPLSGWGQKVLELLREHPEGLRQLDMREALEIESGQLMAALELLMRRNLAQAKLVSPRINLYFAV